MYGVHFFVIFSPGICQRQHCAYYRHLADNRDAIRKEIITFFGKKIAKKFPNASCESGWLIATGLFAHIWATLVNF